MSEVLYLYGFVEDPAARPDGPEPGGEGGRAASPAEAGCPDGVRGGRVRLVAVDGFRAVASPVDADEFSAEAVEHSMRDLDWVAEVGAAHERVVTWFVDHGGIVPARLLTLYSSEDGLRREAQARADTLRAALERFRGLREWDVKVTWDPDALESRIGSLSETVAELDRQVAEAGPGRRYLLERKRREAVQSELATTARTLATEFVDRLAGAAREVRILPPPRGAGETRVARSAALLVPREDEDALRAAVEEARRPLEEAGLSAEVTGPWAPYRFLDGGAGPASGDAP